MIVRGRKIAIIGGAGFIGHSLALTLASRGADVEVIDSLQVNNLLSLSTTPAENDADRSLYLRIVNRRLDRLRAAEIPLFPVDARDYQVLGRVLSHVKPQVVVHLAAVAHAGHSNKDPYSTFDHSLRTLENALDSVRGYAEQFVYFSSSMVYGNFQSDEVDEDHPLNPIGIYGALKVGGEKIVIAYQQVFGLPYTILRPSALYGPGCVSRRVCQIFIENALRGEPLRMEGDGAERIDFTYIDDLVDGVFRVIRNPSAKNQIFNMTQGQARPVREVVDVIRTRIPGVKVERMERDALRPLRGTLDIRKAAAILGYAPRHPIEIGIPKYIDWYRSL